MRRTKRYIEFLLHLLVISLLLYKGYYEITRNLYFAGCIILGFAAIAIYITLFWKQLKMPPRVARQLCYYIEVPALVVTAYVYYLEHNIAQSQYCLMAGFACCALGYLSTRIKFS